MNCKNLEEEIKKLISSEREDDFYDFKQEHHLNKAELLHDIICMANNRTSHDAYIIFGVEDKTYTILGVEKDPNRRNQADFIAQLKDKKFFAGIRPTVTVCTITIDEHELDVLIIKNTLDTPYYLTEQHPDGRKIVRSHHIYTRVGDTNTAINSSADPVQVEYLWRKRFGLHLTPYEKIKSNLSKKEEWAFADNIYHNIHHPEFTIVIEEDNEDGSNHPEFYAYLMKNKSVSYSYISVKYFGTTLAKFQSVYLDGGRYRTITPEWGDIGANDTIPFKYFLRDSIDWSLHNFLFREDYDAAQIARDNFLEVVLEFDSLEEKHHFSLFAQNNIEKINASVNGIGNRYDHIQPGRPEEKTKLISEIKYGIALKKLLSDWKNAQEECSLDNTSSL